MTKILTFVDWYLPGCKAGGPIRTVSNLVELLSAEHDFFVFTRDRDFGDTAPYPQVRVDTWNILGATRVYYTSDMSLASLRRHIIEVKPDVIYLNSFFSRLTIRILFLLRLNLIPRCPVVLAPRGEFARAALGIKKLRKKLFINLAFRFLYRDLLWHASNQIEGRQIQEMLLRHGDKRAAEDVLGQNIHIALDVPDLARPAARNAPCLTKTPGEVRLVFLSRISRMKSLKYAIEACAWLRGEITFDIYGPQGDPLEWASCQEAISQAPKNVKISYRGAVPHEMVHSTLAQYHFFVLPTLGENFGQVILEALSAGCPAIVSDKTPWTGLEAKGIGWDVPLEDRKRWSDLLQSCVDMGESDFARMSESARHFARDASHSPVIRERNVSLFRRALSEWQAEGLNAAANQEPSKTRELS